MIPQRIKLSGFLSYKDEQEICFDESPLWMLSGTNGSGKSSIFDAVTFALFGPHRGGSQSAVELINKESNTLAVEFDFTIEKQLYRVKRTVRRQKNDKLASTQQVMKFLPERERLARFFGRHARPRRRSHREDSLGTRSRHDLQGQVRRMGEGQDRSRLRDVHLVGAALQGKSEKLLDSTPAGRARVLARIVDLERYQKLHAKADDKRRS